MNRSGANLRTVMILSPILFSCWTAHALDPKKAIKQYSHQVWQIEDGLPQNQVESVLQTRDGYLWLATREGLARFDGARFVVFNRENTPGIKNNLFHTFYEDRAGTLWIGTEGGLVRLRDGEFATYTTAGGLVANEVMAICETADGLLIGTGGGVSLLRDGKFSDYLRRYGLSRQIVRAIAVGGDGSLWVGTFNDGLLRLKGETFTAYTTKDGLASNAVRAVCPDREGGVWVGTNHSGVSRLKDGRFTTFTTRDGLSYNSVSTICEDRTGAIWIGTQGGLNRYAGGVFSAYLKKDGLSSDLILAIHEDREGSLWLGTNGGGLNRLKKSYIQFYTRQDGLSGDYVRTIFGQRDGGVWIGTWLGSGLSFLKDGRFTTYTQKDGLVNEGVRALVVDRAGTVWIGAAGSGLTRFKDGAFTTYSEKDGLVDDYVRAIAEGGDGGLWIGTEYGLSRFQRGAFTNYTTQNGLAHRFVCAIYEDPEGSLWVGTKAGGLNRLKDGKFTTYTVKDGLYSDGIFQILEDGKGYLWFGSNKGIFRAGKKELNDFADGKAKIIHSTTYGKSDGLLRTAGHFGTQPSANRTRDGRLWFATLNGVVVVDADHLNANELPPPVVVEQVIVDKTPLELKGGVAAPGRGEVEIHYTGLSLLAPEEVYFKYKLEGYDRNWVEAGKRRVAYYTNLPPGEYHFMVVASNNDGVWNEAGAIAGFFLKPHFHQTWWFYTLCGAAVVLMGSVIGWSVHRLRVRQIMARHEAVLGERNRIAREIHDTFAQEIAGLLAQLFAVKTMLFSSPQTAAEHLDRACDLASTGLADARRLVLDLRHQALENENLIAALSNVVAHLTAGASLEVNVSVKGSPRRLSHVFESNLLRIGQESVANAVRHARAMRLDIELIFDSEYVELRVRDDGCGFDPEEHRFSNGHYGLLGIRERAMQIGGRLSLRSDPGGGTEVSVRVEWNENGNETANRC